ncbi:MAG: ATP-binding cassette domain-containing protein [Anaeroplasmataceae bacterium]|nr:ATP-binding cassette domain-containing protein [Anaeroplasmataceae bacterium]
MLELKNVSKYYSNNGMVALGLRNINLKFNVGEIVAITGDSGSGKSTLLNVITAVDTYEEGEIYFEGNETSYFNQDDMDEFRKNNVSFIFQNYNIIESYTVLQNVILPLVLRGKTYEEAKKEAMDIIDKVGLSKRIKNRGSKLSGGEKQRCVIARALASDSKILACDEPTGNLDSHTGDEIIKLIKEVAKDKLVLIVTHNYDQVKDIVTRKIKISDGEVVEDLEVGSKSELEETQELEDKSLQKLRVSSFLRIILQNLISTPKRTFFSSLVFLVISLFSLLLCLMSLQFSYEIGYEPKNFYGTITKDQIVAFDGLHQSMDQAKLDTIEHYEIYYNNFYDGIDAPFYSIVPGYGKMSIPARLTYHKLNYEIVEGKDYFLDEDSLENKYSDEVVLVMPSDTPSFELTKLKRLIDQILLLGDNNGLHCYAGKITGIALSDDVNKPFLQYSRVSPQVRNYILNSYTYGYYKDTDGELKSMDKITYYKSDRTYISCPTKYEGSFEYEFWFADLYPASYPLEVVYEDGVNSKPVVVLEYDYFNIGPEFDGVYECVIYSNNPRLTKQQLDGFGYDYTMPAREENSQINIVVLYLFIGIIIFSLICLFFISYIILSRIYASKTKEYGILRTLGLVKKSLGRIVLLENLIIGVLSSIVGLVLFIIVDSIYPIMNLRDYLSFGVIAIYFVIVFGFSLLIGRRFNRRLFKFSVNTTLKGEVARND